MVNRSTDQREIIDDLGFCSPDLIENLREMELLNHHLGYNKILLNGLNRVYKKDRDIFHSRKIVIADLGCGNGGALRCIHDWMTKKSIDFELIGIDGNAFALECARNESGSYSRIEYRFGDILKEEKFEGFYDIVILNNVCHHFGDSDIVGLLRNLKEKTRMAIIINDIHRHYLAYIGIKLITRVLSFSHLTRNDGPLSVLRAFRRKELGDLLILSGISNYEICWTWPFRWQLLIGCGENSIRK